ncbi:MULTISPECIES: LacI family DNA-binding transcriptional regulator [Cryobacterium]|uniref:LacI family transcriptional regulator n=1 Tax=Cryobacterium zongtaii TaxID=1259217 RepID=A0A2S3ZJM8_9MICO|nr:MULTISPECIES: LacI family DNA-binding transcriptional regulator [Cryobacterium]POH64015.1 LacI family transcriptional regulator [Cryobacterium zongtaii]POH68245.1 LacI family transcriptional regulator [Cryobacterium zongtaii]TFC43224.1 LacI family transcriptional regulator [Cryobacterium sp. TMN-39-2]
MANIHDVARVAGVSISTVSYALSGKRSIAASTKQRIDQAVLQLDYRANAGARMLKGARTQILALSAPLHAGTHAPAHMAFVLSVVTAARLYDYDVLLLTQDEATVGLRRVARSSLVDGIVLLDVSTADPRTDLVRELGLPATVIGIPNDTAGLTCVDLDFEQAAVLAVRRLVDLGHREIGLIGQAPLVYERGSNFPPRFRDAFLAEAARLGVTVAFTPAAEESAGVRAAVEHVTAALPGMTGLVLHCNEPVQSMVLDVLSQRGISVPNDLSVISACSSFSTDHLNPPLDVIPLPADQSCTRAIELTMAQFAGDAEPHVEYIEPTYVELGSTAPGPHR